MLLRRDAHLSHLLVERAIALICNLNFLYLDKQKTLNKINVQIKQYKFNQTKATQSKGKRTKPIEMKWNEMCAQCIDKLLGFCWELGI